MEQTLKPIRFSHHALALVSSSAVIGFIFSGLLLLIIAIVYIFSIKAVPQGVLIMVPLLWLTLTALTFGVMILPFTLFWPVTKKGSDISVVICSIIGLISAVYVCLIFPRGLHSASPSEMIYTALFGAFVGVLYMALALRFHKCSIANADKVQQNEALNLAEIDLRQTAMEF